MCKAPHTEYIFQGLCDVLRCENSITDPRSSAADTVLDLFLVKWRIKAVIRTLGLKKISRRFLNLSLNKVRLIVAKKTFFRISYV